MNIRGIFAFGLTVVLLSSCGSPPATTPVAAETAGTPSLSQPGRSEPAVTAEPSPTATPTPAGGPARQATVVMNGDLLWHNSLVTGAGEDATTAGRPGGLDFVPLLAGIRPVVEGADLGICHNEVPIAPPGGPYTYYPTFKAPEETLDAVRAVGYDLCTTVSNHSLDDGWSGLVRTLDAMDARGIKHAGTARTPEEADHPTIFTTTAGVKIAIVSGTYDTNGIPRPRGKDWSVPDLNAEVFLRKAATARADGAEIVLAAIHGGDEYSHKPNAQQRGLAERLTDSPDIDLVYGHHVHVVQPWTKINGKWVVYGLGNLVAQHKTDVPAGYEGVTARFTFAELPTGRFEVTKAEYLPTIVTRYRPGAPARVMLISAAKQTGAVDSERLRIAEERTDKVLHSLGGAEAAVAG